MSKFLYLFSGIALAIAGFLFVNNLNPKPQERNQEIADGVSESTNDSDVHTWHEFEHPDKKFKVLVPSLPQHATQKLEDPTTKNNRKYDMFVSQKDNGTIFMISIISSENEAKINEDTLKNIIHELAAGTQNSKVKMMEMGKYKDHQAIDFSIENDTVNIDGKAFVVGNTLYILTSVAKKEFYQKPDFDFFVNSFELGSEEEKS